MSQVVQDTALVREAALTDFKLKSSDTGYAELKKAPYINSTLFPGCDRKLERILARRRRAHSFYSRNYRRPQNSTATRAPKSRPNPSQRFRRNQGNRHPQQSQSNFRRGENRTFKRRQPQNQPPPVIPNKYVEGKRTNAVAAFSAVPPISLESIRAREMEPVGACLLGDWWRLVCCLGRRDVFQEGAQTSSWNESEPQRRELVLPMTDPVSTSLLAALGQSFDPFSEVSDPEKAVGKFLAWPMAQTGHRSAPSQQTRGTFVL
jgi:hypothetical protein